MNEGDIVIFKDRGRYAKWFYGRIGIVKSYTAKGADGRGHCAVEWIKPVKYFDKWATRSHFRAEWFEVYKSDCR